MEPLSLAILIPLAAAASAPAVVGRFPRQAGWILAMAPALVFAGAMRLLPLQPGQSHALVWPWAAPYGLELAFLLDGLSGTFVLMIAGIGALVVIYAGGYLAGDQRLGRFYLILLTFMAAMLGLVLADNLITLFVFWELTSVTSYLLIGFDHQRAAARAAALKALVVTGVGGLLLLTGFVLIGLVGEQAGLSAATANRISSLSLVDLRGHALYPAIFVLVALGCLTKSAQVPFHTWLPGAMAGPTPVSAYLHSATMVKAGVYLLARLSPHLGGTELWTWTLGSVGLATMLLGALSTLFQRDLKRVLGLLHPGGAGHPGHAHRRGHRAGHQDRAGLPGGPRHVQGGALHGRRQRGPRDGHARARASGRAASGHALDRPWPASWPP